ncbi:iron-sulfur cluster repair di-iron protein [Algoriphagus persicinus]|uniref:iron-sulfur cluster repair di-iron protein n=1 Tax=Algoriphagus persicinus TaxID=3108754 RepID=UPI002B381D85|nr:iron-sulfur cluster repair di-iron protein [Algoriphagus sp. E1-3-M2]MEB2785335.1 iron-sulfur cluster repair di-iron protein [Algoriphagus sp. E1-3-M2]
MNNINQLTISEIVSNDYRAALVFRTFGIDFCCKGNQTIREACTKKKTDPQLLLEKLIEVFTTPAEENFDFKSWPLSLLANYIENKHHAMIRDRIPLILKFLKRVVKVHSAHEPNLKKIKALFEDSTEDLQRHLEQEELIIFPFIRKISSYPERENLLFSPSYKKIRELIYQLMAEHEQEGACLEEIRKLSDDYTPPAYACNTYKVAFALLQEFDMSMQKHMHLERNILFPEALALEFDSNLN